MNDAQIPTEETEKYSALNGKPCPHPHWYIWIELGQNSFFTATSARSAHSDITADAWRRSLNLYDTHRCQGKVKAEGRNLVKERHKGSLFRTLRLKRKQKRKQWLGRVTSSKSDSTPGVHVKLLFVWGFIATNSSKIWSSFAVISEKTSFGIIYGL